MRKILVVLALLTGLLVPAGAQAQAEVSFSSVVVQLWPEYDQPAMLVIYDFMLSPDMPLPTVLTIRIPAAAGQPFVVAIGPTPATVADQDVIYETSPAGDWIEVAINIPNGNLAVRLEYYDPDLARDGAARHYLYTWPGDHAATSFHVSFQVPVGATSLQLSPALPDVASGNNQLTYYEGELGPLAAGQTYTLSVDYQKNSNALSISGASVQPAAPLDGDTPGRLSLPEILPWVLGILGLLLIIGGVILIGSWQGGKRNRSGRPKHRPSRRAAETEADGGPIYCPQCGKRAQPNDAFCRTCGSRLRRGE
ncbi:MAG: hypothetical protein JXB85_02370 [Anaerolineales bacterium]|nr:hypothetical protein [Anaerolineales bacterium]